MSSARRYLALGAILVATTPFVSAQQIRTPTQAAGAPGAEAAPTVQLRGEVGRSGSMLYIYALGVNSSGPHVQYIHSAVKAITGAPVISIQGRQTPPVAGPIWCDGTQGTSFIAYQIPPVTQRLQVSITCPAGFITCSAGVSPASTFVAYNSAGSLEPGVGSFVINGTPTNVPGFGAMTPTMKVGYNMSWSPKIFDAQQWSWLKNRFLGLTPLQKVTSTDANGRPVTLSGSTWSQIVGNSGPNGVDSRMIPVPSGTWTFRCDEKSPNSPMVITWYAQGNLRVTATSGPVHGQVINGVEIGKTWTATFAYPANTSTFNGGVQLNFGTPSGGPGNWTITNERLYDPLEKVDDNVIHDQAKLWMTTASGKGPATIRLGDMYDYYCYNNMIESQDIPSSTMFAYTFYNKGGSVNGIQNYLTSTSPTVWFSSHWPGTTAPANPIYPGWETVAPTAVSYLINSGGASSSGAVGEFTFANPHGLKTGQYVTLSSGFNPITVSNGPNSSKAISLNGAMVPVFVTGPNSFATSFYAGTSGAGGMPDGVNNVIGKQPLTANISLASPSYGGPPLEFVGQLAGTWKNTAIFVPVSVVASDTAITTMVQKILATTQPGQQLIFELGVEDWAYNLSTSLAAGFSCLNVIPNQSCFWVDWLIVRSAMVKQLAQSLAAASGRQGDIKIAFGLQWGGGWTQIVMDRVTAYNAAKKQPPCELDAFMVAPYINVPGSFYSPYDQTWIAAGQRVLNGTMTRGQYLELIRHWLKYNTEYLQEDEVPYGKYFPQWWTLQNAYVPGGSQPAGFKPEIWSYEGGMFLLQYASIPLSMDLWYDPGMYDVQTAQFEMLQFAGMKRMTRYNIAFPRWTQGANLGASYGDYLFQGQLPGRGDGSDGKAVNVFYYGSQGTGQCNDFDTSGNPLNVSPTGQAWLDWADRAN